MKTKYKKILILGSGGLRIGQAGEFDYSGSQAIKAIKEEGIKTVLINPNIATVQTDASLADTVYLQPLNLEIVTKIIDQERPDGLLLAFGGQTALNLGMALDKAGVLKKYRVDVLGTPVRSIQISEDRDLFKKELKKIEVKTATSYACATVAQAVKAADKIGFPIMMRSGYSLGGLGSGVIHNVAELKKRGGEALSGAPQILIEEYLGGWKEVEYEVVRDSADNCITVCNMENFDPMGIHTGESIVVAPSQTLNNREYHMLRAVSMKVARQVGVVGECNVQFALNPKTGDYRVIEMNARLSRSSALASKATGYPLAFVAAKLALGKRLDELKNAVTQKTSAFFEPALDYLVLKIPRWDTHKLKTAERYIGTEMKSVGEVMAIGRSFPEVMQKAVRMLNQGMTGVHDYPYKISNVKDEIKNPTDRRLYALYRFFSEGGSVEEAHKLSQIDKWFLYHIKNIASVEKGLKKQTSSKLQVTSEQLLDAKKHGFSDKGIARIVGSTEEKVRAERIKFGIKPVVKQIDTLSGEFPAQTNYLYFTYHGTQNDLDSSSKQPIVVIGSGPYSIGSSVEFDWSAVNTARTLRAQKEQTIIINSNPETVSTDYDESDRLYFDELTFERVKDLIDFENPKGVIISVGGQVANSLALPLYNVKVPILGTSPLDIDRAEDRFKFSSLLNELKIDQPDWEAVSTIEKAKTFSKKVGYPILVRPSYVLSGAAMNVVYDEATLESYLKDATTVSPDHPVVISQFITGAKELEVDGVAEDGKIIIEIIAEHVENAGVHSGDATIVVPPQRIYLETIRRAKRLTRKIVRGLNITGPFNIQFLAKENWLKIIECNLRASRSFPFVSKVIGHNLIEIATKVMTGQHQTAIYKTMDLDYVGIKSPQFSYGRLKGADPVAHVEMASTGEVACIGDDYLEAFMLSWLATEQKIKGKNIFISIGGMTNKAKLKNYLEDLYHDGWKFFGTDGTAKYYSERGIKVQTIGKLSAKKPPHIGNLIESKKVDLIINIPKGTGNNPNTDGFKIRRLAIDHHIPLVTNLQIARILAQALFEIDIDKVSIRSWQEYLKK